MYGLDFCAMVCFIGSELLCCICTLNVFADTDTCDEDWQNKRNYLIISSFCISLIALIIALIIMIIGEYLGNLPNRPVQSETANLYNYYNLILNFCLRHANK